jgi:hypothetical protein
MKYIDFSLIASYIPMTAQKESCPTKRCFWQHGKTQRKCTETALNCRDRTESFQKRITEAKEPRGRMASHRSQDAQAGAEAHIQEHGCATRRGRKRRGLTATTPLIYRALLSALHPFRDNNSNRPAQPSSRPLFLLRYGGVGPHPCCVGLAERTPLQVRHSPGPRAQLQHLAH